MNGTRGISESTVLRPPPSEPVEMLAMHRTTTARPKGSHPTQEEVDAHFREVEAYSVRRNPSVPTAPKVGPGWWSMGLAARTG